MIQPWELPAVEPKDCDFQLGPASAAALPRERDCVSPADRGKIPRRGGPVLRGQIPVEWLHASDMCGRKGMPLAVALWWLAGEEDTDTVRLTNDVLTRFGISARVVATLLRKMQQRGLIEVVRHDATSTKVRLLRR